MHAEEIQALNDWFLNNKRDFPWRESPTPYEVWVSEVMLQQTQASVVVPYFRRWMALFPTLKDLAQASLAEVIKAWEGLGYYSRARNLHNGAIYISDHLHGILPSSKEKLNQIPGLGPYTTGAILSFAFHQKAAAVDGNVTRVVSRYYGICKEVQASLVKKEIVNLTETLLPDDYPWVTMEALIELGARICTKSPKCESCPLSLSCSAYLNKITHLIPCKKLKIKTEHLTRAVGVVFCKRMVLVKRVGKGAVMADLHEFPYLEISTLCNVNADDQNEHFKKKMKAHLQDYFSLKAQFLSPLPSAAHSFTKYKAHLFPTLWEADEPVDVQGFKWIDWKEVLKLPFSAGHRQVVKNISRLRNYAHIAH